MNTSTMTTNDVHFHTIFTIQSSRLLVTNKPKRKMNHFIEITCSSIYKRTMYMHIKQFNYYGVLKSLAMLVTL